MSKMEFEQEQEKVNTETYGGRLELEDPTPPEAPELPKKEEEEEGQLSLFGEEEKAEEKPKKEDKKASGKSKPKAAAKEQKVTTEFMVYYAGNRVPVPENNMTLEKVREFLEMDFPELSKERTEMTLDAKKKEIVPVVKGAKKG